MVAANEKAGPPSRWLTNIRREQLDKELNDDKKKNELASKRYMSFVDSDSEDERQQDIRGKDLLTFLDHIDRSLKVEQTVLNTWAAKDKDDTSEKEKT